MAHSLTLEQLMLIFKQAEDSARERGHDVFFNYGEESLYRSRLSANCAKCGGELLICIHEKNVHFHGPVFEMSCEEYKFISTRSPFEHQLEILPILSAEKELWHQRN
jgi:hypothetical protein